MEFLDRDVKKMPSLSYTEYLEGIQSYDFAKNAGRP